MNDQKEVVLKDIKEKIEEYLKKEFPNKLVSNLESSVMTEENSELYGIDGIKVLVQETDKSVYYKRIK